MLNKFKYKFFAPIDGRTLPMGAQLVQASCRSWIFDRQRKKAAHEWTAW
jgi:hypothetical protein